MGDIAAEPDAVFSNEQWAEIARTIGLATLPMEMKQAISQALYDRALMSGERRNEKQALNRLVRLLQTLRARLSALQTDLRPEKIIDQLEALIEEAYALQKAAELELEKPTLAAEAKARWRAAR